MLRIIEGIELGLIEGDITVQETDAIVNAANSSLTGGGGVDGAIHRAGGPEILEECKKIVAARGRLPTGKAVITGGGRLKAKFVIHTVGPVWRGGVHNEAGLLASAYAESLKLAVENSVGTICFPSISTGAYGYPIEQAAKVALRAVIQFIKGGPGTVEAVTFVLYSGSALRVYQNALRELAPS